MFHKHKSLVRFEILMGYVSVVVVISSGGVWKTRDLHLSCNTLYLLSPRLCFFIVLKRNLFVYMYRYDSLTS